MRSGRGGKRVERADFKRPPARHIFSVLGRASSSASIICNRHKWRNQVGFRGLKLSIRLGEKKFNVEQCYSVILSILHENVFQLYKIHTKIPHQKFIATPLTGIPFSVDSLGVAAFLVYVCKATAGGVSVSWMSAN